MAILAAAAPYITAASTALTIAGAVRQGQQAKIDANQKARELHEDANAAQAQAQREAIVRRRQGAFAASRARAVAAASGAGVSDTTADTLIGRIETQSDLNVLNALYEGNTVARGLRDGARKAGPEARASRRAGFVTALSRGLQGGAAFYENTFHDKYGGGFKPSEDDSTTYLDDALRYGVS